MRIHFIAIGGSAMHNLALALHDRGDEISGSDDVIYEPSRSRLDKAGLLPNDFGWYPEKLDHSIEAVILGMHAKKDNPELKKAQDMGLRIYSYPEFLYEQAKNKTRVVIAGSHGKTTISSMILHVMNYHNRKVDYMIGAQLEGFDRMVKLTDSSDFILLEGDEYLSSPIDLRSKFLWYKPNIALVSGIAWDHINVFPTLDSYHQTFKDFVNSIVPGGSITYFEEDEVLNQIVNEAEVHIRRFGYDIPPYQIEDGITYLETEEGEVPLEIFGAHNLANIAGAKWICQQLGIDETEFYEAISTFSGAQKRLEKIWKSEKTVVFKDFAHSPSKVKATTNAVITQYKDKNVIACLELHTYSSLNQEFIADYHSALDGVEEAMVFYSPEALAIKKLEPISKDDIKKAFGNKAIKVFTEPLELENHLLGMDYNNAVLLLMSSGNYGGMDLDKLIRQMN